MNPLKFTDVDRGDAGDLAVILAWLKLEYDEDGSGFWSNRGIVGSACTETHDLWVIRQNGEAIAFQVGNYAADIVAVRRDFQGKGLGEALFKASLARALSNDVNVLTIQCEPKSSLGFWQRMGFVQYNDRQRPDDVMARRVLTRSVDLPPHKPVENVVIGFYPEEALYYGRKNQIPPIVEYRVGGVRRDDGSLMLDRRVICLRDDEPDGKDIAIRIEVDDAELYFGKAKYEEARDVGVIHDSRGRAFYVDALTATDSAGPS